MGISTIFTSCSIHNDPTACISSSFLLIGISHRLSLTTYFEPLMPLIASFIYSLKKCLKLTPIISSPTSSRISSFSDGTSEFLLVAQNFLPPFPKKLIDLFAFIGPFVLNSYDLSKLSVLNFSAIFAAYVVERAPERSILREIGYIVWSIYLTTSLRF